MAQERTGPAAEQPKSTAFGVPDPAEANLPEPFGEAVSSSRQDPGNVQNLGPPPVQEIARIITSAPDLSQASQPFFNAVQKLAECQVAAIYAINESTDVVTTLLFASTLPILRKAGDSWPFSGSLVDLRIKLGYPHVQDLELDAPFPGTRKYLEAGIKFSLWAPLVHQGRTIGALLLRSVKPDAFDQNQLDNVSRLATLIAPSVEKAVNLWETRQDRQTAQALSQSRESLNTVLDYRQALELICQKCCQLLASSYAILAEVEGDELVYRWAWPAGIIQSNAEEARFSLKQPDPGLAARVALTGQAEVINYVSEPLAESLSLGLPDFAEVNSVMAVPLVESGLVIGVLITGHIGTNRRFVNRYLSLAEAFASQAAATLQNARLHQAAQQYSAEIALVAEISRILASTLNIDEIYERFADEVKKLVDFDRINIHVINAVDGAYTIKHLAGPAQDGLHSGDVTPLEGTQTQQVMETGQPSITYDYAVDSRFRYDRDLLQAGLRSRICLPLSGRGNFIGSLSLHSRRAGAYGLREQAILERLAHQIGPAIENARLYEQVRFQAQLMDNARESIVATDLDGRVTYWGKGAQALYGYSAPEVMGKAITFIVRPEEIEEELQRIQQAADTGSWRGQYIQQRKDGPSFWADTSISLVRDSQGRPCGLIGIDRDITEQKEREEALRRSEAQQRALIEAIPDAMFRIGRDGSYLGYTAPKDFELLAPPDEFLGKTIYEVMPPKIAQQIMGHLHLTLRTGEAQTFEYQLSPNGQQRDYEARLVVSGEEEVLAMVRDVTERKLLEAQFFQAQKMESLGRLAGGIAHDFNNLLAGIMGYASLLRSRLDSSSESYEFAQIIEKATQRGAQLTQQLLTAARKSPFQARPLDVNEVVQEVVQILSRTLPKATTVVARLQPKLPQIEGDLGQVHQVLMNLCINAADAMPQGGALTLSTRAIFLDDEPTLQRLSLQRGQHVQLSITDTGVGISEDNLPKIFEPFFTTKGIDKGTGLGLSVVYAIVKNHQGAIEVASEAGQGSAFTVYLPVHDPNPHPDPDESGDWLSPPS